MKKWLLLMFLIFASRMAAACNGPWNSAVDGIEHEIRSSLSKKNKDSSVDFGYLQPVCKEWQQKQGLVIIAIPYVYLDRSTANDERYFGMVVAVVNKNTGTIRGKYDEGKLMAADAIEPSEIKIDTANYAVQPGQIAFGVRVTRHNHSDVVPISEESMNIYLLNDDSIVRIVKNLLISSYNGEGGGDCRFSGTERSVSISVSKIMTHGYFNLVAKLKENAIRFTAAATICKRISTPVLIRNLTLKFEGKSYEVPDSLRMSED